MWLGKVPMLTKGSFAIFYGGPAILPLLSTLPPSPTPVVFFTLSLLFQFTFWVYKKTLLFKVKLFQKFGSNQCVQSAHRRQRSAIPILRTLQNTVLEGLTNTYSVFSIIVFSLTMSVWAIQHLANIEHTVTTLAMKSTHPEHGWTNQKGVIEKKEKEGRLSFSVIFGALVIMGLNLLQFSRNIALR